MVVIGLNGSKMTAYNDNEKPYLRLSDEQVWQHIIKIAGVYNSSSFQELDKEKQRETLRVLLDMGFSVRQLQRLTGLGRGIRFKIVKLIGNARK